MTRTKKKYFALTVYCLCFFTVWTVFELCVKSDISSQFIKSGIIKPAVWTLPAMLLIHKFRDTVRIGLKEMFIIKVDRRRYLWVYALLVVWPAAGGLFQPGGLSFGIDPDSLIIVLFAGITEETAFRGWLLNATAEDMPDAAAVLINAVLFLAVHFPRWIHEGIFISTFTSFNFIGIVALGIIFGVSFLKSKNILVPITMHMLYDFTAFAFLPQA